MGSDADSRVGAEWEPRIVDGLFVPTREVPFSDSLDGLIAEISAAKAPNLGRFCGYCCAPLGDRPGCSTCGTSVRERAPREKVSRELAKIYHAKRRREARLVHGAAWLGLTIGVAISVVLILVLPSWTKVFGVLFLIFGSFGIASYLGNYAVQDRAYRSGLRMFAERWQGYAATRERGASDDD